MVKIATRSSTKLSKRNRVQLFDLHELLYSPLPRINKKVKKTTSQKSKSKSKFSSPKLIINTQQQPIIPKQTQQIQQTQQTQQQPPIIPNTIPTSTSIYRLIESNSVINGSTIWENCNTMVLTNSTTDKIGSCFYNNEINIENKSWINEFTYTVETNGTDGLTFILHNSKESPQSYQHYKLLEGGQLEYNDDHLNSANGGILAIEFKTSLNDNINSPNSNQIIIKTKNNNGSNYNLLTNVIHSYSMTNSSIINNTNNVRIEYNHLNSSIKIIYNGQILLTNIVIPSANINFPKFAYFGYTAATGYCIQKQSIRNCKLTLNQ
ncbi:hypothetical protein ACTFIR_009674 [Dictyostelium discoideum]